MRFYYFGYSQPRLRVDGKAVIWEARKGCIPASNDQKFYEELPKFLGKEAVMLGEAMYCRSAYGNDVRYESTGTIPLRQPHPWERRYDPSNPNTIGP